MRAHTFIAATARQALERIRAELGPSAVVLSVRRLPRSGFARLVRQEQIEVLAAAPPEPESVEMDPVAALRQELRELKRQLQSSGRPAESAPPSGLTRLLTQTGVLPVFAERLASEVAASGVDGANVPAQIEALREMLRRRWRGEPLEGQAGVHVFVGVPGSGKSTVLCKMLSQSSLLEQQPATVYQLDTHRANASPQPAVYAEILGANFQRTLPLRFERREESVYIDLPGAERGDDGGLERIRRTIECFGVPEVHLVLNFAYESTHLLDQIRFFSNLGITDIILTHLDEEPRWGKIWNVLLGTNYIVRYLSMGQNIPGEFHQASPDLILRHQFPSP